jgi:hypothetical protein
MQHYNYTAKKRGSVKIGRHICPSCMENEEDRSFWENLKGGFLWCHMLDFPAFEVTSCLIPRYLFANGFYLSPRKGFIAADMRTLVPIKGEDRRIKKVHVRNHLFVILPDSCALSFL